MSDVDISIRVVDKEILASLKRIERGFQSMQSSATRASNSTSGAFDKMASSVRKFESSIVLLTRSFQLLAAGGALNLFRTFVNDVESANNALRSIAITQSQFSALQEDALQTANATGAAYRATAASISRVYRSIEEMGYSAQSAIDLVSNLNKTLLISGATSSEAISTLTQFTQALQSGVLQGDELRSLRENAPLLFQQIAKSAGVATAELKKMGAEGKLTTKLLTDALLDPEFTKSLDELRSRMELTFTQSLQIATNNFAVFFEELNRSSGVLRTIGELMIRLSESIKVLADFKATSAFIALTAALIAYRNTVLVATLATNGFVAALTLVVGAAIRAAKAVTLFIRSNPVLLAASLAVGAIAYAYDRVTGAAKAAKDRVEDFQKAAAKDTFQFNDFLRADQLDALTKAKAALEANKKAVEALTKAEEELRKKAEQTRQLRDDASTLLKIELQSRADNAARAAKEIDSQNSKLEKTVRLMMQIVAYAKQALVIGDAVGSARKVVEGLAEQLKQARGLKQTEQERIQAYKDLIKEQERIALNAARERGDNAAATELIRLRFQKLSDDAEIYVKQIVEAEKANKEFGKSFTEKKEKAEDSIFGQYREDIRAASIELSALQQKLQALESGASESETSRLDERLQLETKIAEIRAKYAKTGDGGEELIELEKRLAAVATKVDDATKAQTAQEAAVKRLNEARLEGVILAAQLAALEKGASEAELEAIRARITAQNELTGAVQGTIDAVTAQEEANEKATKTVETKITLLQTLKSKAEEFGEKIGTAFGEVVTGAKSAGEAVRALLLDVIKLIVKFLALRAIQLLTGTAGAGASVLGSGGVAVPRSDFVGFSSSAIRVYNYGNTPGGVQARRRSDGSVDVIIGQITSAIQRGGNPLDATLRRTYGINRVGV